MKKEIEKWLEYAILAPSAHNTQPWQVKIKEQAIEIYADPAHMLRDGDPTTRETMLGLGTFAENLIITAAHFGYKTTITESAFIFQIEKPCLVLSFTADSQAKNKLFAHIPNRHTNRGLYKETPLSAETLQALSQVQTEPGIAIDCFVDDSTKARIGQLVGKGVRIGLSMPSLKRELANLVSFLKEAASTGMLVETMAESAQTSAETGKEWLLGHLDIEAESAFCEKKFAKAPLIAVLSSNQEGPQAWLQTGRVLQRFLLTAAGHNLTHCISAAPVEIPTLAPSLRKELSQGNRPEVVVRVGRPLNPAFTITSPRRGVNEIIKN